MKKFLVALVALVATAAMVAPAFAEDRLSLGGEMRVRGWYTDFGNDAFNRTDGAWANDTTQTWGDQRLRIGGKLAVADGVSVTFRTDITESDWGSGSVHGSGRSGATQQWDRAHLDLTKGIFHLRAGQQFVKFGNSGVDIQNNGLLADLKVGPGQLTAFGMLVQDNGISHDGFLYGVKYAMKNFSVYEANQNSLADLDEDVYLSGGTLNLDLGALALNGEVEVFYGDANALQDAVGAQAMVGVDFKASDIVVVGGEVYYSLSTDDPTEVRYTLFGTGFDGWDPLFDIGTGLSNEQIGIGNAYDIFDNGGLIAGRVKAIVKPVDALQIGASVAYAMPEDDKVADEFGTLWDYKILAAAGLSYALMDNTSLDLQVEYVINENPSPFDIDNELHVGTGLFVKF